MSLASEFIEYLKSGGLYSSNVDYTNFGPKVCILGPSTQPREIPITVVPRNANPFVLKNGFRFAMVNLIIGVLHDSIERQDGLSNSD